MKPIKDLRTKFLCEEKLKLLMDVSLFASDYVHGIIRINNLKSMNVKGPKEAIAAAKCNNCKRKFNNTSKFLFCAINKNLNSEDKFKLVCEVCTEALDFQYNMIELYPTLTFSNVKHLCEIGFLTKYIFPLELNFTKEDKQFTMNNYHDFYKTCRTIVKQKQPHEEIVKIELRTYGRTLFCESSLECMVKCYYDQFKLVQKIEFNNPESELIKFLREYHDDTKLLTYFYSVKKHIYSKDFDYKIYFAIPCQLSCTFCKKTKLYLNKHPILYCSQCGFTDAMFFKQTYNLTYIKSCIKMKVKAPKTILYYDLSLYKNKIITV
jgi:Baculoviridae ME53